jgi:hypothetical protein
LGLIPHVELLLAQFGKPALDAFEVVSELVHGDGKILDVQDGQLFSQ